MARIDLAEREITLKLVYYGPALSGKTTNLRNIHERAEAQSRGRMLVLDTQADRTLFFDLLPLHFTAEDGFVVRVRVYTVPGQVMHNATRKVVLQDVDGVAFVADSRVSETSAVNDAFANLRENLRENGIDPDKVPVVVQMNKRDLPNVRAPEELAPLQQRGKPVLTASALHDEGVLPTFFALCRLTFEELDRRHGLSRRFGLTVEFFLRELAALFGNRL